MESSDKAQITLPTPSFISNLYLTWGDWTHNYLFIFKWLIKNVLNIWNMKPNLFNIASCIEDNRLLFLPD